MLKGLRFSVMLMALIGLMMTGCDDSDSSNPKTCDPACSGWEMCDDGTCKTDVANGKCVNNDDCTDSVKTTCGGADSHTCIDPNSFSCDSCDDTYQTCNETDKKCDLKDGMCASSSDCTDGTKTECDTDTHMCKEPTTTTCTDGDKKCEGDSIMVCGSNAWSVDTACGEGKTCKVENDAPVCADKPAVTPIADVKAGTVGNTFTTMGVVTSVYSFDDEGVNKTQKIYIQDGSAANSGILLYAAPALEGSTIKVGDEVEVTGTLAVYPETNGSKQLGITEAPVVKAENKTVTDASLAATDLGEDYVHMRATMTGGPFTVVQVGNADNSYVSIIKDGSDNQIKVMSRVYRFNEVDGFVVDATVTKLAGLVMPYNSGDTKTYELWPLTAEDIVFEGGSNTDGTEGNACRAEDPKCDTGLVCNASNICEKEVVDPCNGQCTENQYCNTDADPAACVDLTKKSIVDVKAMTEAGKVWVEGTVTFVSMYNNMVGGVYLQEGTTDNAAIYVYIQGGIDSAVKAGDTVKVVGLANVRFGVVQIGTSSDVPAVTVVTEGDVVPDPKAIAGTDLGAPVVDMLVEITGGPFVVTMMGTSANGWNTMIKDASDNELVIRSDFYRFADADPALMEGSEITKLVGLAASYQNQDETFTYSVKVRSADDITFTAPDMSGKEGYDCREADPKCDEGLQCNAENKCEVIPPCNGECTEDQICDQSGETDVCVEKYEVKTVAETRALELEMGVKVTGTVTGLVHPYETTEGVTAQNTEKVKGFFIQDGEDAIYVYTGSTLIADLAADLAVGKTVEVKGYTGDYHGSAQIMGKQGDDVKVAVTGDAAAPAAVTVTALDESVESELVTVTGNFVVTVLPESSNNYVATFTDGETTLMVSTDIFRFETTVDAGFTSITGFVKEGTIGETAIYAVMPRSAEDMVAVE